MAGLYDYNFCSRLVNGSWDYGIINNLEDAKHEIKQNFDQMDLENASVQEELRTVIEEMRTELTQLINSIQSVQFE